MFKKYLSFLVILGFVLTLNGCATARKQKEYELQNLKNQVSLLESQVQSKDEEIAGLKDQLNRTQDERTSIESVSTEGKKVIPEIKSRPNNKQIQIALKNAGYNPGNIDGKLGRQTKEAIKTFQRDNKLIVDGSVGKKTWKLLKPYLYQQQKVK